MAVRTFLAINLDEAILDRLEAFRAMVHDEGSKINWTARRNLHITLNFLGDVPDEVLAEVCDITQAVAKETPPFEFSVVGVSAVPPRGAPRMFWAGVDEPDERLTTLQQRLAEGFATLPLRQEERGFKPHITLARIKVAGNFHSLRSAAEAFAREEFGVQAADEVVAYASQLSKDGPIYTPIARAVLGGREKK